MKIKSMMKVYKIRDTETGMFSKGGMCPYFDKEGKTWPSRGALKSHLTQLCGGFDFYPVGRPWSGHKSVRSKEIPQNWEVVEYVLRLEESNVLNAKEEQERPAKK